MRTWPLLFLLVVPIPAGCTSTPGPERAPPAAVSTRDAPAPETMAPETMAPETVVPEPPFVAGRFLHTVDGERLRVRLGLHGRWSLTSVAVGDGYLVTDDRYVEGTLGTHRLGARARLVAS